MILLFLMTSSKPSECFFYTPKYLPLLLQKISYEKEEDIHPVKVTSSWLQTASKADFLSLAERNGTNLKSFNLILFKKEINKYF